MAHRVCMLLIAPGGKADMHHRSGRAPEAQDPVR